MKKTALHIIICAILLCSLLLFITPVVYADNTSWRVAVNSKMIPYQFIDKNGNCVEQRQ